MNPQQEYSLLINYRACNPLPPEEYGENHHIYPRCCGGNDAPENIIKLTPEEHYKAHFLLPFIFTEGKEHAKLLYAWSIMQGLTEDVDRGCVEYGILKREFAQQRSIDQTGKYPSDETRAKMSASQRALNRVGPWKDKKLPEETKSKMSSSHIGHEVSEETRRKIGDKNRGKPNFFKGKTRSEETKRKMSEAKKLYWANKRRKLNEENKDKEVC